MSNTVIDKSENVGVLSVGVGNSVTIEKDTNTPPGESQVFVGTDGIALGLGSTVLVQNYGVLNLQGVLNANLLGQIDIGDHGTLRLRGEVNANLLSSIHFVGHDATTALAIDPTKLTLGGSLNGFGLHDVVRMDHLVATSIDFTPYLLGGGGTVNFFDGSTEVAQLGFTGNYTAANFAIASYSFPSGDSGTALHFVPTGDAVSSGGSAAALRAPTEEHFAMAGVGAHGW